MRSKQADFASRREDVWQSQQKHETGYTQARPKKGPSSYQKLLRDRIAQKAYSLYEQRGQREGYALQDWLDAEYLVNEQIYEAH